MAFLVYLLNMQIQIQPTAVNNTVKIGFALMLATRVVLLTHI